MLAIAGKTAEYPGSNVGKKLNFFSKFKQNVSYFFTLFQFLHIIFKTFD